LLGDNENLLVLKDDVQENAPVQINPQSSPLANPAPLSRSTVNVFQFYRAYKK